MAAPKPKYGDDLVDSTEPMGETPETADVPGALADMDVTRRNEPDAQHTDLGALAAIAARTFELSRDPADEVRAIEALRKLHEAGKVPDFRNNGEAVDKATMVVDLVGEGMPQDPDDPDFSGKWRDLQTLIGKPVAELLAVTPTRRGVAVRVHSGTWYIYVGRQNDPDADGKRGVMFLTKPERYKGPFPVFASTPTITVPAEAVMVPPASAPPVAL
jgi:hypothetical protein